MNLENLTLVAAVVLGLLYLGLGVVAYQHMKPESRVSEASRLLAFTLWWPLYNTYEKSAKTFRILGFAVLLGVSLLMWPGPKRHDQTAF